MTTESTAVEGAIHPRCLGCERLYPMGLHESCADVTIAEEGMGWGPSDPFPGDGWHWWDHHICDALCDHEGICEPPPRPFITDRPGSVR